MGAMEEGWTEGVVDERGIGMRMSCACLCASGPRTRAIVILNALTRESPDLIR